MTGSPVFFFSGQLSATGKPFLPTVVSLQLGITAETSKEVGLVQLCFSLSSKVHETLMKLKVYYSATLYC